MRSAAYYAVIILPLLAACTDPGDPRPPEQVISDNLDSAADTTRLMAKSAVKVVKSNASEATGHAYKLEQAVKTRIYSTTDTIADWMMPDVPKPPLPVAARYCYRVLQDVLCYRAPMPGGEFRLVGYQGTNAAPPPPALMQPLPMKPSAETERPANRVADAKPVFTTPPPELKDEKKLTDPSQPTAVDPTHEQLPNPALAPQL